MIIATLDLPVARAEKPNTVSPAEAALTPASMDHPAGTTTGACTTRPSAAAGVDCAATLHEAAPGSFAATNLCELVAECPDAVS